MKNTGIVRKIDSLGRIVLPKELRKVLNIKDNETPLEIYTEGEEIILKKYEPACIFCGEAKEVINFKGKNICKICLKELVK
ncbi:TPA: AbrB/MazE/SpoVT family DNA-binding domain-containing protein [Clostridium botulinum]|uniref:AbrB/MazE/SpoVT family DNA-binding domain-containing protein n=1 Tax=Clostridium botulinum TaxID=1491 RepID=UPI000D0D20AD|nr:AbrB/MazE/SpoVT family DNA-binding domain-containing protein [Clostridium botulinum]PSM00397.1 AbrB family transcriptional regulator [Clostridium botulinum]HDK7138902.1 AbrB/MazE/SpoVT family DNA-binding domain-containing protein [Clostridium botulinum]HDK7142231.1 AbrB/MazE/SpoVT family DNA-binding domain-containing protein [Clostridium botulinum]HDK7144125.1 AbrB/MazE/SpoVT family DNA-binding domain-containing protein [Clostridium botulinum]HDK7147777.1 AbrB/MazE/SpoVT family DNA-binding 